MTQNWNRRIEPPISYLEDDIFVFLVYDNVLSEKGRMMRYVIKCKNLSEAEKAVIIYYNKITCEKETEF